MHYKTEFQASLAFRGLEYLQFLAAGHRPGHGHTRATGQRWELMLKLTPHPVWRPLIIYLRWCCIEFLRILLKTFYVIIIENHCSVVQNCGFQEAFVCNVGAYGGCKYDSAAQCDASVCCYTIKYDIVGEWYYIFPTLHIDRVLVLSAYSASLSTFHPSSKLWILCCKYCLCIVVMRTLPCTPPHISAQYGGHMLLC